MIMSAKTVGSISTKRSESGCAENSEWDSHYSVSAVAYTKRCKRARFQQAVPMVTPVVLPAISISEDGIKVASYLVGNMRVYVDSRFFDTYRLTNQLM
jgi:hypothetical protein